jgi:hypothetical protein
VVRFSGMMSSFSLTNGEAYIRCKLWNLVQIQPIGNEEFVSASDATVGGMMSPWYKLPQCFLF